MHASNALYVTLGDVFDLIYRNLSAEFNLFSQSRMTKRRATRAYEKRYRQPRNNTRAYEEEKRGKMKRVDFLMGHIKFLELF